MKVIFSPQARNDLQEIFRYIARDNLDAAIGFVRRLRQRCLDVAPMPYAAENATRSGRAFEV